MQESRVRLDHLQNLLDTRADLMNLGGEAVSQQEADPEVQIYSECDSKQTPQLWSPRKGLKQ